MRASKSVLAARASPAAFDQNLEDTGQVTPALGASVTHLRNEGSGSYLAGLSHS